MKIVLSKIFRNNKISEENTESDVNTGEEDYIAKCTGSFGLFQGTVCTVAGSSRLIAIWNLMSLMFLTPKTNFFCKEFHNNVTVEVKNSTCYENCLKYEYFPSVFESTLISEFDLICENAWLAGFTQAMLMLGVLIGSCLFGWVSDRFGRRLSLRLCTLLCIVFMVAAIFSTNYWIFTSFRALVGATSAGIFVISGVYILEVVGTNHKEAAGSWAVVPDGIAEGVLPIFAYCSTSWQMFLLEYWGVSVLIFLLVLGLPETPRYLVANNKTEKAVEILTLAAKWNKKDITYIGENVTKYVENIKRQNTKNKTNLLDLFRTKDLSVKTICVTLLFVGGGVGFYGISQYVTLLETNIYVSVALMGLIQIPVCLFSIIINKYFGRRTVIASIFLITAISMVILTFLPKDHWGVVVCGVIGSNAINITYIVLYIYIAELYPTPLRNSAAGFGSCGSCLGSMVTPFIATLTPQWLPSTVLAAIPFFIASVCFILPETKGRLMKDIV